MEPVTRIAMWSGPRNISTALMRAFENRPDTWVVDEPFYAIYLNRTGIDHPMRDEVIASQSLDYEAVVADLTTQTIEGHSVFYQKHMTQHMLPNMDLSWTSEVVNCFLIRSPEEIVASYSEKRSDVSEADLGLKRQFEIFEFVKEMSGRIPPVLDSNDVLKDPKGKLSDLCQAIGIPFSERMLSWPNGRRESDGVWAPHWYQNVEASTGFTLYNPKHRELTPHQIGIAEEGRPYYDALKEHAL